MGAFFSELLSTIALFFSEVIAYVYGIIPNFGVAIIILTILVKVITFPLNNKQIQSSKKMQLLQPEMKKIQQKYKDDKEKQNQAMSEFMRENNVNPLSGCLPLLVQFPILIGIFRLLQDPRMIELKIGEEFSPYLFPSIELINLMEAAMPVLSLDNLLGNVSILYIFPLIAGVTTYLYSKMSMPADSSQKMMLYMMPVMITVFSFNFPTGLVIYWIMNNVFSLGQHKLIGHLEKAEVSVAPNAERSKTKDDKIKEDKIAGENTKEQMSKTPSKLGKGKRKKGRGKK